MEQDRDDVPVHCCANCGRLAGVGITLKACKSCMSVKYCNAKCQKKHRPKHKKVFKQRAAELHDEALFKDPPSKEDCPICFLPMPTTLICCVSLPPATITSLPITDFAAANEGFEGKAIKLYYSCCGKSICKGCVYSFCESGNNSLSMKCPFCKAERMNKTDRENIQELRMRVDVNYAGAMYVLGSYYYHGNFGLPQVRARAMELYARAAELKFSNANRGGDLKKAKFHLGAAAMAGHELARYFLGGREYESGNMERAVRHFTIGASAGCFFAMHSLQTLFEHWLISRGEIDSTLTAYNNSCADMRSEARDKAIRSFTNTLEEQSNCTVS